MGAESPEQRKSNFLCCSVRRRNRAMREQEQELRALRAMQMSPGVATSRFGAEPESRRLPREHTAKKAGEPAGVPEAERNVEGKAQQEGAEEEARRRTEEERQRTPEAEQQRGEGSAGGRRGGGSTEDR